ncbi:glycosyltransferase [Sulfurospirillum sp. T05]|uniref:Glycosyltransferase n=1 Tax=Sulfurospirillum tamanense TaxID=2813362 RepID=A0ABS2WTR6_9BACT|nr:glycosyltransferase family 2 protein [Sulfurospirillum tamanensis]MBN2965054.1 glycosyltransferase [Sulfurospirillum tamanensis]
MRYLFFALILAVLFQTFFWITHDREVVVVHASHERIQSLSYTPHDGNDKTLLSRAQIAKDMSLIATYADNVRTYATQDAMAVLEVIGHTPLTIDLGMWLGRDYEENYVEFQRALYLLQRYPHRIRSVIVGNETLLRKDLRPEELAGYIFLVSQATDKPVTTAEVWHTWMENPWLAEQVDYVTVHILPYWEKVSVERFNAFVEEKYTAMEALFPGVSLAIGETGWPSHGYNNKKAVPSLKNQAIAVRSFLNLAKEKAWTYNIIEAFDQPWKGADEGNVGQYWGIFDSQRGLKFSLDEEIIQLNKHWKYQMVGAVLIGVLLTLFGLKNQRLNINHALAYAVTAQGMAFGIVMAATYPFVNYMNGGMWVMWGMGTMLMIPLVVITLAKANELFGCSIGQPPRRLVPINLTSQNIPLVSIHVPAYKEQPHVLEETLRSLAQLRYPNFEVLVIINNTPEEYYWKPIEALCQELGERFVFLNITCTGFKAGALNRALEFTHPEAEIIAVIDADYVVKGPWLVDLVPLFDNPKVAIVQAPQDHRDGNESIVKAAMNAEYAGFFDIGMIDRNEENAIVVHGTMVMVRRSAMMEVGGWGTDTIVEDSELGLRLFEAGYVAHYTNRRYGYGLLPDTIEAFKTQRHRWAYGAIQILKKHWREFKLSATSLTPSQKHKFATGWFFWLSDAMGPLMAMMNILWVPVILFVGVTIPTIALTIPIITAFLVNILHTFILYRLRVKTSFKNTLLSAIASMSLQLIIFKAVYDGFVKDGLPFKRTEKGGNSKKRTQNPVKYEMMLGAALIVSCVALIAHNTSGITEIYVYAVTLVIQSIPYLSAVVMWGLEKRSS